MIEQKKKVIAIAGCGTVGGAVAKMLSTESDFFTKRSGCKLELKYILDLDFAHAEALDLEPALFTRELGTVLSDPEVDIVVELIGGTSFAKDLIASSLESGKDIVTANKALLAVHGDELFRKAREHGHSIAFEASCGGGIPIIRALYDGLFANRVDAIYGIVNGTCNYILSEMTSKGRSYQQALNQAQADGLAEADPSLDVSGEDSAHKIAIMATIAFGRNLPYEDIYVKGIDDLSLLDVQYGSELGYVVKLLAIASKVGKGICLRVRPAFISRDHPIAWVSGPFNAISVYGHATGHTMYYGRGAGGGPTASAVIADLLSVGLGSYHLYFRGPGLWPIQSSHASLVPVEDVVSRYYIRMIVEDRPGTLAKITSILGDHNISISSILQKELPDESDTGRGVPIVITTHPSQEGNVRKALEKTDQSSVVRPGSVMVPIVDEHEEWT